jgi:hypothetical protein
MKDVGMCYGHLVHFTANLYTCWSFGIFSHFGTYVVTRKIWLPRPATIYLQLDVTVPKQNSSFKAILLAFKDLARLSHIFRLSIHTFHPYQGDQLSLFKKFPKCIPT